MIEKIVFSGAESTGKSFFSRKTAVWLKEPLVSEYAVFYLHKIGRPYRFDDLEIILKGQLEWEKYFAARAGRFLICDTDPLVLYIWSMDKFGKVSYKISDLLTRDEYSIRFLCFPDIPWQKGDFREDESRRFVLHEKYIEACCRFNLGFEVVRGEEHEKLKKIQNVISENMEK